VYVKRPDKFLAIIRGDNLKQRRIYFDGKYFVRLNVEKNIYQKFQFDGDINEVLDHLIDTYDIELPLSDLMRKYSPSGRRSAPKRLR
jgi:hypothetical protein